MSNEPKDSQPKKTPDQIGLWLSIGIALGIMLGAAIGTSLRKKNKKG